MKKILLILLTTIFGMSNCQAKDFSSEIHSLNAAGFPKIQINLKVFNKSPEVLKADNFVISEDKVPISSFALTATKNRHLMILVIDRSSSIEPAMRAVKEAAAAFVKSMSNEVSIAILSFGSDLDFNHRFSNDADSLTIAISKIRPWGGTLLYDAIFAAAEELNNTAGRNDLKTVVCLTDGRDSRPNGQSPLSTKKPEEVIEFASEKNVRIITVGLGQDIDAAILQNFAVKTRGWYLNSAAPEQLGKLYQALSRRMKLEKYYRLTYTSPKPEPDGSKRFIDITSNLKGVKDQGTGEYTAPTRTVHVPPPTDPGKKPEKLSLDLLFSELQIEGPDSVFLTGPIIPPPDSPVIGPNSAAFLGNSADENLAIIEQARARMAQQHKENFDQKNNYLNQYLQAVESLQQQNDLKAASGLKDFEKPRVEYRNKYLKSRRQEINLFRQMAYETYLASFKESSDELDYLQRIHVQGTPEEPDFLNLNNASASATITRIENKFEQQIAKCRQERDEMFAETLNQSHVTHTIHRETLELPGSNFDLDQDSLNGSGEIEENADEETIPGLDGNFDDFDAEVPELREIAPFD